MKKRLLILVFAGLMSLVLLPEANASAGYSDVPEEHWAAESIQRATELGYFQGVDEGRFGLGQPISRAAFSSALVRMFGWEEVRPAKSSFDDVDKTRWFYTAAETTLATFDIEARFCNLTDPDEVRAHIGCNTCAIFLEVITNPQLEVADLKMLSSIAKEAGVPLIADTTIVPFSVFHGKDFGIDIEIVSSTKYISGGATSIGGLILDNGTFDWSHFITLKHWYEQFGERPFTARLRKEIHRNLGAYMTPQVAYMQTLGLETMPLRFERQGATCLELAGRLQTLEGIVSVNYTGLKDNPYYKLSTVQFGKYPGAMLTFDLPSREACFAFMNRLQLIRRATNLFDNKTLAIHPASTIYGSFTEMQRQEMDISQQTIRLSVGLEPVDDLYNDIKQALAIR